MATFQRWLYSLILHVVIPIELIRLLVRSVKVPEFRARWGERFVLTLPAIQGDVIWFHTVSVGETLAALPVIRDTLSRYPNKRILVTTMTPTGSERVKALLGDSVSHCYTPYDLPFSMKRFFAHVKPQSLCIMETELWPNMLHYAAQYGTSVILMNARMSDKSARGYRHFPTMTRDMLHKISHIAVHNHADAERFMTIGADKEKMSVTGNIKFDMTVPKDIDVSAKPIVDSLSGRPVWLAASTHQGEDEIIIEAHRRVMQNHPDACLIIVPRHPERFEAVYQLCHQMGMSVSRRSELQQPTEAVFLGDTMGELLVFCYVADMAFVGGSLINRGGHNCLEVSALAKPVMSGPHDFNFAEINKQLNQEGGLAYVSDAATLAQQILDWYSDTEAARMVGQNGYRVVENNRGALSKLVEQLAQHLV